MEALRKQANKLRETVTQHVPQGVFKNFTGSQAPTHSNTIIIDEAELQRHQQLEGLYGTTKSAKHFQREVVKSIEAIINNGVRHIDIHSRLSDECNRYGHESSGPLAKPVMLFASAHSSVEKERDLMHRALGMQVADPLKSMVTGAPLEDARNLTQRYDKMRQEAEAQAGEIQKRSQKIRDGTSNAENSARLQIAEQRLAELSASMAVLGKEAAAAMMAVDAQQQRQTMQRLITFVEAEKLFHQRAAETLDQLLLKMVNERQQQRGEGGGEGGRKSKGSSNPFADAPPSYEDAVGEGGAAKKRSEYFLAEVLFDFEPESSSELRLISGDYVVVRQVSPNGWSEGELRGKAGWFPSSFVERRQRVPASKILETGMNF